MISQKLLRDEYERLRAKRPPVKPRLTEKDMRELEVSTLDPGTVVVAARVQDIHAERMNLTDLEIAKCSIRSCVLRDCEIAGGLFDNVAFIDCDLSNSVFTLSGFRRCELIDCKLIGADLSETVFENVLMRGCSASLVSFSHSKWKEVRIQDCDFVGADMGEMDLSRVSLIGSRFTGANLFKTGLAGIDLTSCNIEGITISDSLTELRGCKMDINQMDTFARMLGILLDC